MPIRSLIDDTTSALRHMRRKPRNFIHLVLILAVGFGCVTGGFDIAYRILHNPFPSSHPERVVVATDNDTRRLLYSYDLPNSHLSTVFQKTSEFKLLDANLESLESPRRLRVAIVTADFFSTLGVAITTGHDFVKGDDAHPANSALPELPVVLSQDLWRACFASDRGIVGKTIQLNIPPYRFEVIGVAPQGAAFPSGVDAWAPIHLTSFSLIQSAGVTEDSGGVLGLLKPGISLAQAETGMRAWPRDPLFDGSDHGTIQLKTLTQFRAGDLYPLTFRLWLATLAFLALTILAAAAVYQSEGEMRRQELAIKRALGATPGRQFRALVVESAAVALVAVALSCAFRAILIRTAVSAFPLAGISQSDIRWFDFALVGGVAALFCASALLVQWSHLARAVPETFAAKFFRCPLMSRNSFPLQSVPAAVIFIVAALLARSSFKTMQIDTGVDAANVSVCEVSLPLDYSQYLARKISPRLSPAERGRQIEEIARDFRSEVDAKVSSILHTLSGKPGVMSVGAISIAPYTGIQPIAINAQFSSTASVPDGVNPIPAVVLRSISPGALATLNMRLLSGKTFSPHDDENENTIIVNEALARLLPSSPLGQYIKVNSLAPARIVGVVANVHESDVYSKVWPTVYFPFSQYAVPDLDVVLRMSPKVSGSDTFKMIQDSIQSVETRATASHYARWNRMIESAGTMTRYSAYYLLALALISTILAGLSTSSRTAAEFARRKHEVGIRMALGAMPTDILRLFLSSSLRSNLVAALAGAALAWWFSRLLEHALYGIQLIDPISYCLGIAALIVPAILMQTLLLTRALRTHPKNLL